MMSRGLDPERDWLVEPIGEDDAVAHAIERTLHQQQTGYQHLRIVESRSLGRALVLDNCWQSSTTDEFIYHEAIVHAAALEHGAPRSVLILGGAEGASAREALRWRSVRRVVTCDIDVEVVDACRRFLPEMSAGAFDDPRHELVIGDAFEWIDRAAERGEQFDLIVCDLSDPLDDGPSRRLFTLESFARCRDILEDRGVFIIQAGGLTPAELPMHARLSRTLREAFGHASTIEVAVPIFGTPLAMILASAAAIDRTPVPDEVDRRLENAGVTGLRFLDGRTLLGLYQIPLHVRRALREPAELLTLDRLA